MKNVKDLFIPPVLMILCLAIITTIFFVLPAYNRIPFPYNFGGLLISVIGFMIMGKTRGLFKKYKTTLTFEESSHMIMEGPFLKTRNPMYLGMFLLLMGAATAFMNLFGLLLPFLFFILVNYIFIPKEEQLMEQKFGRKYHDYRTKVRKWL